MSNKLHSIQSDIELLTPYSTLDTVLELFELLLSTLENAADQQQCVQYLAQHHTFTHVLNTYIVYCADNVVTKAIDTDTMLEYYTLVYQFIQYAQAAGIHFDLAMLDRSNTLYVPIKICFNNAYSSKPIDASIQRLRDACNSKLDRSSAQTHSAAPHTAVQQNGSQYRPAFSNSEPSYDNAADSSSGSSHFSQFFLPQTSYAPAPQPAQPHQFANGLMPARNDILRASFERPTTATNGISNAALPYNQHTTSQSSQPLPPGFSSTQRTNHTLSGTALTNQFSSALDLRSGSNTSDTARPWSNTQNIAQAIAANAPPQRPVQSQPRASPASSTDTSTIDSSVPQSSDSTATQPLYAAAPRVRDTVPDTGTGSLPQNIGKFYRLTFQGLDEIERSGKFGGKDILSALQGFLAQCSARSLTIQREPRSGKLHRVTIKFATLDEVERIEKNAKKWPNVIHRCRLHDVCRNDGSCKKVECIFDHTH